MNHTHHISQGDEKDYGSCHIKFLVKKRQIPFGFAPSCEMVKAAATRRISSLSSGLVPFMEFSLLFFDNKLI